MFGRNRLLRTPALGGATVVTLLLDSLSASSLVAFSTRKLTTAYGGFALQVTTSAAGNATQDIGFVGQDLDTAALATFIGANTGTVTKWYDQSGNGHDATTGGFLTAPVIRSGSTTNTLNTHASIVYTSANAVGAGGLLFTVTQAQPISIALVAKLSSTSAGHHFTDGLQVHRVLLGLDTGPVYQQYAGGTPGTAGTPDTNSHGIIGIFNTTASSTIVDGSTVITSGNYGSDSWSALSGEGVLIGAGGGSGDLGNISTIGGQIPEYIGFASVLGGTDQGKLHTSWQTYWGTP